MIRNRNFAVLLATSAMWLAACATTDVGTQDDQDAPDRDQALQILQGQTGAPVAMEINDTGATRVVAMTPRFHAGAAMSDPAGAATAFLAANHDLFKLTAAEAASVKVTRVDADANGMTHVTLQRLWNGTPIFQGALTVHSDATGVFRALGDEFVRIPAPLNQKVLTPTEAAIAAGKVLGLNLQVSVASVDGQRTVLDSPQTLDQIHVTEQVVQISPTESRLAYQATVTWTGADKQMQMQLVLVDAADGSLLTKVNLVNDFTGTVFTTVPSTTATTDTRSTGVSFDGDPTASPSGWVGTARKTIGNNAVAATDLNANNTVGTNETQPTADANNAFVQPFSLGSDAAGFKAAAVINAFYLVNQYHDLTYKLGFTESAGNFQTSNFGKGGAQADEVQVDAQDGSGTNNANFGTPPDGQKPRMQMFLFNIAHGTALRQDGDFDPSVIWHENTHGVSNRLVGGGTTACLNNLQSGGMGEGWGDFMGGSFLSNPVVGAYVTGDAINGIRSAPMNNSPFTYASIKNGTLSEVHDAGELWAATLWSMRTLVGKATAEQLVIAGMKLTPCRPSMISARDAIIQADANLNAGANRCKIFTAFASKAMGSGASSPNDTSTTQVVTSTALPADCIGTPPPVGTTRTFTSTDVPKLIPDNNTTGVRSAINVATTGLTISKVLVNANITHTFRGDLVIQVIAPNGEVATLSNRAGGAADNFSAVGLDITSLFTANAPASGTWQLFVRDLAAVDTGSITAFNVVVTSPN
jgi:hypothetical protein